jgi:predicted glycosyltransferase
MADVPRRLSFLSYAVNGAGVGHVVRQVAIQRWLKRFCAFAGTKSEHWFLTTSEADTLCFHEGFGAFKLPSKTIVDDAGLDKTAYIAMAKQWVWNSLTLLRPDVLIVDTFPNGSFHELGNALDVVAHKALVLRPVKQPFARRGAFQGLVQLYDRVIVPEHEDDEPELPGFLAELGLPASRVAFTGPLVRSDRFDAFSNAEARKRLGIPPGHQVVLVTGGGGGDSSVDAFFDDVANAVADRPSTDVPVHIVFAAGPLFRGPPRRGPGCTFFNGHDLAEHLAAVDVAVCAAGFNTIHELLFAGVPTLVIPQSKIADDQQARALRYAARGALRVTSRDDVAKDLAGLLTDAAARALLSENARRAMPVNHARDAAREILGLVLPPSLLKAADSALSDTFVAAVRIARESIGDVVDLALALQGKHDRAAVDVAAALALVGSTQTPAVALVRVIEQLRKKVRVADDAYDLCGLLLSSPAIEGQHAGLVVLLQTLAPERGSDGRVLVEAIVQAAERAAGEGKDLLGLARTLPGLPGGPNLVRLRAAAT